MANNIMSTIIVLFIWRHMNELIIKDKLKVEDMIYTIRDNR